MNNRRTICTAYQQLVYSLEKLRTVAFCSHKTSNQGVLKMKVGERGGEGGTEKKRRGWNGVGGEGWPKQNKH